MYHLQSHPMADYVTGRTDNGDPIIVGLCYPYICAVLFGATCKLAEVRARPLTFEARAMRKGAPYLIEDPDFQQKYTAQAQLWCDDFGLTEQPIVIERFSFPPFELGIEDLPRHMQRFKSDPDDFPEQEKRDYVELIDEWIAEGNFVLWWGTDYYLDKEGGII